MLLEINCADDIHIIRELWKAVIKEKKKRHKGIISDSQQTFQVNALARENNVCPWDVKVELKKKD